MKAIRIILLLALTVSLSSCVFLVQEINDQQTAVETDLDPAALAALVNSALSCTEVPTEALNFSGASRSGITVTFFPDDRIEGATHYYFFGRDIGTTSWNLIYIMPASEFDSGDGAVDVDDSAVYEEYYASAAINGCLGPASNIVTPPGL